MPSQASPPRLSLRAPRRRSAGPSALSRGHRHGEMRAVEPQQGRQPPCQHLIQLESTPGDGLGPCPCNLCQHLIQLESTPRSRKIDRHKSLCQHLIQLESTPIRFCGVDLCVLCQHLIQLESTPARPEAVGNRPLVPTPHSTGVHTSTGAGFVCPELVPTPHSTGVHTRYVRTPCAVLTKVRFRS